MFFEESQSEYFLFFLKPEKIFIGFEAIHIINKFIYL